jgi:ubiquitin carboxyl-terminal hydrolase 34
MDVWALEKLAQRSENDTVPDLVSTAYLAAFGHLLRKEEAPNIGKNLETHYDWNWDEEVRLLSTTFQAEGGNILPLTKLTEGLLKYVSQNPKTIDNLVENCKIVQQNLEQIFRVLHDADRIHQQDVDLARNQLAHGYRFYEVMADGLTSIIEKQVTSLAPEAAMIMLNSLAYMLMKILSYDDDAERPLLETARREQNQIPLRLLPMVVATHWKFTILKKLIMSTQMQLRVNGVTTMCSELLRLWNENKNMEPSQAPVLLCFANFIIDNRIIEYLVGIGSHPEIINESYNILGFLIVTKTYTDSQAATTWETVTSSQDPRVVDALLKMLKNCFNLQNYSSLLLICQQVNTLPMGAFTPAMREFLAALIRELMLKASNDSFACLDAPPYELCVRLVRESSRTSTEFPSGQPDVQNFAGGRLRELLSHGPASDIRHQIYSECIVDVAARTETASGSICVINALLRQNVTTDIRILTTEHGLTKLVIQELESAAAESQQSLAKDSPASVARRELVRNIIIHEPGTISPTLGSQLWKLLVGEGSGSVIDRNTSWQILNTIMKKSSFDNVFLETCFKDHLPALPPSCFAIGTLDFVREAIVSWLDKVRPNFLEEDRTFEDLALDQLWRIILEAPASTIDAPAIGILVEVYVESSLILSLPRAKAKAIHLALVDRCLKQLATAASKLKSYDRENIPGKETDDMLLDDSGGDFQTQEMIFARSLAVLREFLRAYQSKPQFATPKSKPLPPMATSAKDGEKITIKYQTFDGDTHSDVTDFTIGKLDPVASVFAQLEKETGFNNYKVYCNGKVVDPEEVGVCKSMEDLNFSGLVLIQRREGQDGSTNVIAGSKTTLEFEIMKHFDELWGYLGMHETVAKEVGTIRPFCI